MEEEVELFRYCCMISQCHNMGYHSSEEIRKLFGIQKWKVLVVVVVEEIKEFIVNFCY